MGAQSRLIMDWLDRLESFHKMSGKQIDQHPISEDLAFNYYSFYKTVENLGGYKAVHNSGSWTIACSRLSLPLNTKSHSSVPDYLKEIYQDIIKPFEDHIIFLRSLGIKNGECQLSKCAISSKKANNSSTGTIPFSNTPEIKHENDAQNVESNGESSGDDDDDDDTDYVLLCEVCDETCTSSTISCSECNGAFHRRCLENFDVFQYSDKKPQRGRPSKREWYCPKCLIGSCEFAFQRGDDYTLSEFETFAESFQKKFMKTHPHLKSMSSEKLKNTLEEMFWKYVNSPGDSITVEYGSDIRCNDTSGFPSSVEANHNRYAKDPWNLNNLPLHRDSLFHNISTDISGMTQPWIYVGMLFSAFCWHCEDHYTYSVNYQHFGDLKTWYGIPGDSAEKFEQAMKDAVPELFEKQPDLLFQLVTMISPDFLTSRGIPCYTVDQAPGQFVVTWPKAYHAGFNHGFNCNEAVNFAPLDWLPYGAESIDTYKLQRRAPVFSFDSLLIRTARLEQREEITKWLYPHFKKLIENEINLRTTFISRHPDAPIYLVPGEVSEEEYQCCVCHSLPYLSRIVITRAVTPQKRKHRNLITSQRLLQGSTASNDSKREQSSFENTPTVPRKRGRPRKMLIPQEDTISASSLAPAPAPLTDIDVGDIRTAIFGEGFDFGKEEIKQDSLTVCHTHIVTSALKNFSMEFYVKWTNDELLGMLGDLEKRSN